LTLIGDEYLHPSMPFGLAVSSLAPFELHFYKKAFPQNLILF
jgi:hypothetical protein